MNLATIATHQAPNFTHNLMASPDFAYNQSWPLAEGTSLPRPHPRSYRPRNKRSCDSCRARKSACKIDQGPPCYACHSFGRDCTFTERPHKRKRSEAAPIDQAAVQCTLILPIHPSAHTWIDLDSFPISSEWRPWVVRPAGP